MKRRLYSICETLGTVFRKLVLFIESRALKNNISREDRTEDDDLSESCNTLGSVSCEGLVEPNNIEDKGINNDSCEDLTGYATVTIK